jgi:hypothetical protein
MFALAAASVAGGYFYFFKRKDLFDEKEEEKVQDEIANTNIDELLSVFQKPELPSI